MKNLIDKFIIALSIILSICFFSFVIFYLYNYIKNPAETVIKGSEMFTKITMWILPEKWK